MTKAAAIFAVLLILRRRDAPRVIVRFGFSLKGGRGRWRSAWPYVVMVSGFGGREIAA